ncbi:histidine phosphatase family protein [Patescibacteria group bacterium]|nr:histidine phosphatase family protein [Patescibacteria group bacterium]
MKFYIIRHGKTELNGSGRTTGQLDIPITEEGRGQVETAIKELPNDIVGIYSSDLLRTKQTTDILNRERNLPVTYDARLRERSFGSLDGQEWSAFDPDGSLHEKDTQQEYDYRPYGGESAEDVRDRVFAAFKDIAQKENGKSVLIVAHGGVIRLLHHIHGNEVHEFIRNGSIHEFSIDF